MQRDKVLRRTFKTTIDRTYEIGDRLDEIKRIWKQIFIVGKRQCKYLEHKPVKVSLENLTI